MLLSCLLFVTHKTEYFYSAVTAFRTNISQFALKDTILTLIYGHNMDITTGSGWEVAVLFQGYVSRALRLRRAGTAGAAAGAADV